MSDPDFFDFMIEGGDDLLNTKQCSHYEDVIDLDQDIEWIDEEKEIAKCPRCGSKVKISKKLIYHAEKRKRNRDMVFKRWKGYEE